MKVIPEGQCIQHTQYGVGFVTEADAERTTIDFLEHGPKKFVTSLMTVTLVADGPPRPKRSRRIKKA